MAQGAYNLERFAARPEVSHPRVKVVKTPKSQRYRQELRAARIIVTLLLVLGLASGVLYTQSTITELQSQIHQQKEQLVEEEAMYDYMSAELEGKTNLRLVQQRAAEMGLVKMDKSQVTYIRLETQNKIESSNSAVERFWQQMNATFMNALDYLNP